MFRQPSSLEVFFAAPIPIKKAVRGPGNEVDVSYVQRSVLFNHFQSFFNGLVSLVREKQSITRSWTQDSSPLDIRGLSTLPHCVFIHLISLSWRSFILLSAVSIRLSLSSSFCCR